MTNTHTRWTIDGRHHIHACMHTYKIKWKGEGCDCSALLVSRLPGPDLSLDVRPHEHDSVNQGGHDQVHHAAISNQQSGAGETPNRESQSYGFKPSRRRCTISQALCHNSTRLICTRYTEHTNHTRTAYNRMAFRRQLRVRQRRHNQSSELAKGKPAGLVR